MFQLHWQREQDEATQLLFDIAQQGRNNWRHTDTVRLVGLQVRSAAFVPHACSSLVSDHPLMSWQSHTVIDVQRSEMHSRERSRNSSFQDGGRYTATDTGLLQLSSPLHVSTHLLTQHHLRLNRDVKFMRQDMSNIAHECYFVDVSFDCREAKIEQVSEVVRKTAESLQPYVPMAPS